MMWKKIIKLFTICLLLQVLVPIQNVQAASSITLFTPYTGLSVAPGESITYDVDVINDGNSVKSLTFQFDQLPKDWQSNISAGGNQIKQLSIKPGDEEQITVDITVPLKVKKDDYRFQLVAKGTDNSTTSLPFLVSVTEEGTTQSNLTTDQPNREGDADSTFTYTATLKNDTAKQQNYALSSKAPEGWGVQFNVDGETVTSIVLEPNESKTFDIEITPAENVTEETYTIPIQASSGNSSSELELEIDITGIHSMTLSTPNGNLSTNITAGKERKVDLVIENDGTRDLTNIELSAETPPNWQVTFEQNQINVLKAGEKTTVTATIQAPDEAIAGDYVTLIQATAPAVSSEAALRVSVKTSVLWGAFGIVIIAIVIGGLYYIFRKYGRR